MSKAIAVAEPDQQTSSLQRATAGPERLITFLKDVRQEMRKVVMPSRAVVQSTTIVVIVTVFIFAAYFELVDLILGQSIDKIFAALIKQ
ncbi:MAG: preprotein translocase subunit SecE [Acidobacteriota bacterium]|nr:preprotein translocase subunit SecE [Acidobacteriota bacterium]